MSSNYPFRNAFLTQLMSIDLKSREFLNTLATMLASQEGMNTAISLQGDDAVILVDILDQAFEAPDMSLDLRRKSDISKEGDAKFASRGFTDVWKGRHDGNRVCIRAFRAYTIENLFKIKLRLFQEIVVWRRLSHTNDLPVLGVSPKLFPLCIITEWMIDGNIMDFTSKHPEVNRLRLLAEAAGGLQYLHSMGIIHSGLKPTNILIDRNFHPRLTDYGLVAIILDPGTVEPGSTTSPSAGTIRYMAPELLYPCGFGLKNSNPTKRSDIYAFGVVTYQVITGQQPFPGAKDGAVMYLVVTGERPGRPAGPNEWLSNDVWNFISRCWSPSWDGRPDVDFAMNALNDAADAVEVRRRKLYATTSDQGKRTSHQVHGALPPSHGLDDAVDAADPTDAAWEVDLVAFLRTCKTRTKAKLEDKKAQEFADKLDAALDGKGPLERKRKQYLRDLGRLCRMFGILPTSFVLTPTFDERGAEPFAKGGYSEVYKATIGGRCVAVKALKFADTETVENTRKLLVKEVVGWKWVRHDNILPFVGVLLKPPLFSIISEWMENGNIMSFIRIRPNYNRLRLLTGAVAGLVYLHEHGIVHGDLKGANILVDSECCARLADFGFAAIIDESTSGSTADNRRIGGTARWMAPELLHPEEFGFTDGHLKRLPSMSTDIYAIGMTILEVLTGCYPFNDSPNTHSVTFKVIKGCRPSRPASGFSDTLWESLAATWVVEDGPESKRRPPASVVLGWLRKDVDHWEKSIVPLVPKQWQENVTSSYEATSWADVDASDSPQMMPTTSSSAHST